MNKVKVSIIIPIYNPEEQLLKKCLDSALNQTLNEIEVLCINDGSDDATKDILREYSGNDSRCKLITQENSGSGAARNNGIEHSNGDYIVFLDADDWIEPEMCESLYGFAEKLDVDLVLFDTVWHREENIANEFIHFNKEEYNQDFNDFIFDYGFIKDKIFSGYFGVIWTKFYKSSFIKENDIHFPSHKLYNDIEFHTQSLILAKKIAYCPEIFYHYNKYGHESLQTSYRGKKEAMVFYDVIVGIREFLLENDLMKEMRIDFLNFAFENFIIKLTEMSKDFKQDYFLKIKSFFESMGICPNDFDEMNFKYLPYYLHMINSKDFNEFKARLSHFDKELINPERYVNVNENNGIFDNQYYKFNNGYESVEFSNNDNACDISDLDLEEMKLKCSDKYILVLENSLVNEHKLKDLRIHDLTSLNNANKERIKNLNQDLERLNEINDKKDIQILDLRENLNSSMEEEKKLKIQNKKLFEENEELKNTFYFKFKSFFKRDF